MTPMTCPPRSLRRQPSQPGSSCRELVAHGVGFTWRRGLRGYACPAVCGGATEHVPEPVGDQHIFSVPASASRDGDFRHRASSRLSRLMLGSAFTAVAGGAHRTARLRLAIAVPGPTSERPTHSPDLFGSAPCEHGGARAFVRSARFGGGIRDGRRRRTQTDMTASVCRSHHQSSSWLRYPAWGS